MFTEQEVKDLYLKKLHKEFKEVIMLKKLY